MKHKLLLVLSAFLFVSVNAYSKIGQTYTVIVNSLPVYSAPVVTSKTVSTLSKGQTLIPFYKKRGWYKIGNSQFGLVGWIQENALAHEVRVLSSSESQGHARSNRSNGVDVVEYTVSRSLTRKQVQEKLHSMEQEQRHMRRVMNRLMKESINDLQAFSRNDFSTIRMKEYPVMQPVIILPMQTLVAHQKVKLHQPKPAKHSWLDRLREKLNL